MSVYRSSFTTTAACLATLLVGGPALADDTEIFVGAASQGAAQPNILLIVDNSTSMEGLLDVPKAPYDAAIPYGGSCDRGLVYLRAGAGEPPACGDAQRVPATENRCHAAAEALVGPGGFWTGRLAQWNTTLERWGAVEDAAAAPLECQTDAGTHGEDDGSARRWARNGDDANRWTAQAADEIEWSGIDTYTAYSANWLNWYHAPPEQSQQTRMRIVQDVATSIVSSIDGVNLGLMRFSNAIGPEGDGGEGGSIDYAVDDIARNRAALIARINSYTPETRTPLSETLYEAGQYFAGRRVDYGVNAVLASGPTPSAPASRRGDDPSLYRSPITAQCQKSYIVLLTDGEPSADNSADAKIAALPDFASLVAADCDDEGDGRCLDDMAAYLNQADLSSLPGRQSVSTFVVGFGPDVASSTRLAKTATRGGGEDFSAGNVTELTSALQNIVSQILQTSSTFTTPSVAVNAFNRSQTLNELYISVFRPEEKLRWPGNLKKYGVQGGRIVDVRGVEAVDPATGFFREDSQSYWSQAADGDRVDAGGALSRLPDPAARRLYTFTGADRDLTAATNALALDNAALTDVVLGTDAQVTREKLIRWARGYDAPDRDGDGDTGEAAPFMGDPLHARPAVVPYGGVEGGADARDVVVYVPTNDGYLHAVDARTGRELWAFVPPELLPRLPALYRNPSAIHRSYGIDGDVRVLKFDVDQDGRVEPAAGDRVWIFFGMRRGGRFYYALDVTDRDRPALKWKIGPSELPGIGETWSTPAIARVRIAGAAQNGEHLVLIFGGGYDEAQEGYSYAVDPSGHRLYMVDAASGVTLWYAGGPNGAGSPDLSLAKMTHSIPSRINVLDTDGDQFADRMYASDVGGRIWRFDIRNGNARGSLVAGGVLAELGASADPDRPIEATRRFYYAPDVALIQRRSADPYYNLAVGSGYRGHPLHTETQDRFYSIRDKDPFSKLTQSQYDALTPIAEADLIDVTGSLDNPAVPTGARGWKLELRLNGGWVGEKVLAEALTVNGVILFPTYQPPASAGADPCTPANGTNRVYALRVDTGKPAIDFNDDQSVTAVDVSTELEQTGIAGEVSLALETLERSGGAPGDGEGGGDGQAGAAGGRDALGRRTLCYVGIEVLRKCVQPGGVVRTFWERAAPDDTD